MATKMCPVCGSAVPAENQFCGFCGADVEAVTTAQVKPTRAQKKLAKKIAAQRKAEQKNRGKNLSSRIREEQRQLAKRRESQRAARRRAKTVQDALGFEHIYADGIARVEDGLYAQTLYVPDINFRAARPDEQDRIWNGMCNLYNSLAADMTIQLTLLNSVVDASNRYEEIKLPSPDDPTLAQLTDDYNAMLAMQVAKVGKNEIIRRRYITVSMPSGSHEDALVSLSAATNSIIDQLEDLGAHPHVLNGSQYLELVGAILRPDEGVGYDYETLEAAGVDVKDVVSPTSIDFAPDGTTGKNDCWRMGGAIRELEDGTHSNEIWYQTLQLREPLPAMMDPSFVGSIIGLPMSMVMTIQVHPIEQAQAINEVQKKLSFLKTQEAHEGRQAAREGLDPIVSRSITLTQNLDEGSDVFDALINRNERLFECTVFVTTWHRSRAVLMDQAFRIAQEASKRVFQLAPPKFQHRDSLNTMLPFGNDYMAWHRKLLTTELATFLPFVTQELTDKGGVYYGNNQLSNNLIILNRKKLAAPMGWIMGKPGSGKSFAAKQEIFDTAIAHPNDDIFIIDPKGEYTWLTEQLGGQVIDLSAGSRSHLNPFDLSSSYSPDGSDPVIFKSSFVTSLISSLMGENAMTPAMLSTIDRAVTLSYEHIKRKYPNEPNRMPTLTVFWQILKDVLGGNGNDTARELAEALEIYVTGSLNVFGYESNVNMQSRIIDFNMKRLQYNLRLFGQLVTVDAVWNRTTQNHDAGKRTWIYIDEAQNFFESQAAIEYFTKYWAEGRSYGLIPTGITQNADRIIHHPEAKHMFSNSEFVELLSQAPNDLRDIQALFNLSDNQAGHIRNSLPGQGLLIAGAAIIPFKNEFPKDSKLYDIMDTDPNAAEQKRRAGTRLN